MTSPTPAPTTKDLGSSIVRTFVATAVGTALAYFARKTGIVFDGPTADGVVQAFTASAIGAYYLLVRLLESKSRVFGWFLGLAKQPKYVNPEAPEVQAARERYTR